MTTKEAIAWCLLLAATVLGQQCYGMGLRDQARWDEMQCECGVGP